MFKTIKQDEEVLELIKRGDMNLDKLGYTEHSVMHCSVVAKEAERILKILGYDKKHAISRVHPADATKRNIACSILIISAVSSGRDWRRGRRSTNV